VSGAGLPQPTTQTTATWQTFRFTLQKGVSFKLRIEMISAIVSKGKQMRKEMFFVQRRKERTPPVPAQSATKRQDEGRVSYWASRTEAGEGRRTPARPR